MGEKKGYVKLWLSYETYFGAYTPEQVGNLTLAMLAYKNAGTEPEFYGPERFIWPAIRRDIDESRAAQEAAAEQHRACGRLGGPIWFFGNQIAPMDKGQGHGHGLWSWSGRRTGRRTGRRPRVGAGKNGLRCPPPGPADAGSEGGGRRSRRGGGCCLGHKQAIASRRGRSFV